MLRHYRIGDLTVYPAQGVTEITGIESREISGNEELFYVLTVLNTGRKIMVPLNKATMVGLRDVIDEKEVESVYDILRERPIKLDTQNWNRRYRKFLDKIKTGSLFDVAEVLRDLYLLRYDKPLSFKERTIFDVAKSLLVKELSIVKKTDESRVEKELDKIFPPPPAQLFADTSVD
ncbi:MAG: CarD family transcriptional regulator [Deltaproteobacteria bacterium]|nr:CarD family transcriptional regulator [Deltaproteobacteria bacterium]